MPCSTRLILAQIEAGEVPGRNVAEIPHPLVEETAARIGGARGRVRLIHLNHTNRLLWDEDARERLAARGLAVARDGEELPL